MAGTGRLRIELVGSCWAANGLEDPLSLSLAGRGVSSWRGPYGVSGWLSLGLLHERSAVLGELRLQGQTGGSTLSLSVEGIDSQERPLILLASTRPLSEVRSLTALSVFCGTLRVAAGPPCSLRLRHDLRATLGLGTLGASDPSK